MRYGADVGSIAVGRTATRARPRAREGEFEIVYVGAMTGWWSLRGREWHATESACTGLGAGSGGTSVSCSTSARPRRCILARAIIAETVEHPDWTGRVKLAIYGNPYPAGLVSRALANAGVERVVSVVAPVAHDEVAGPARARRSAVLDASPPDRRLARGADLGEDV